MVGNGKSIWGNSCMGLGNIFDINIILYNLKRENGGSGVVYCSSVSMVVFVGFRGTTPAMDSVSTAVISVLGSMTYLVPSLREFSTVSSFL